MTDHFNLPGHSLKGNFEIIPVKLPPILGSKTETDRLRLEQDTDKIIKEEYFNLQTVMKKPIMARPVIVYTKQFQASMIF